MVDWQLRQEIEAFLFEEARLLDSWRLHDWLDLFTDDARYWMPSRENLPADKTPVDAEELSFGFYDEDKPALLLRIRRLDTGLAHVEEPRSITRHMISNVLVREADRAGEVLAGSNFMVFQVRHGHHENLWVGRREDVLRRTDSSWKIASRKVILDQLVTPRTVSIFF
ncbi:MAG TPA: aromatic-ring-hydroxylating dioxygenase subunit beta [Chloroflexota bacterium]|nr:aromatic-ring-hydroxylating dioxygenase subunit beta [Chloroflexota bacterium]